MVRPTLRDLNPDELHHCLFITNLERCDGIFDIVEDPFGRICVPNKQRL